MSYETASMRNKKVSCFTYRKWLLRILMFISPFLAYSVISVWPYPFWWWWLPYHRRLCETVPSISERPDVYCANVMRNYITPFKVEYLSRDPDLVLFHQLLPDENRRNALNAFMLKYGQPSPVYTLLTDSKWEEALYRKLNFRVSNITSTRKYQLAELPSLYDLVDLVTGLTTVNLDGHILSLQTYEPVGHIIPHHDVFPGSDDPINGRRFATLILYLMTPDRGGATIFPKLGVAAEAVAGDAVYFFNVYPNGDPDYRTSHAGCPVWKGRKTLGTFWFRLHHQEFLKPCVEGQQTFRAF